MTPRKTFSHDINEIQRTVRRIYGDNGFGDPEEEEEESMEGEEEGEEEEYEGDECVLSTVDKCTIRNEFEVYKSAMHSDPEAPMVI